MATTLLGSYLRARRERLTPAMVGLPARAGRRVSGLRREEVAALAGISADYYQRLEQGRDQHPSQQVIEALAGVLHLDVAGTRYLLELAAPATPGITKEQGPLDDPVPLGTLQLLEVLHLPAFVTGRRLDILATNEEARALAPSLAVGRNRLRDVLLDPNERDHFDDWNFAAERLIAVFRTHVGADAALRPIATLIRELLSESPLFRAMWLRQEVTVRDESPTGINHPQYKGQRLARERLAIEGVRGQNLVIFHGGHRLASISRASNRLAPEPG